LFIEKKRENHVVVKKEGKEGKVETLGKIEIIFPLFSFICVRVDLQD